VKHSIKQALLLGYGTISGVMVLVLASLLSFQGIIWDLPKIVLIGFLLMAGSCVSISFLFLWNEGRQKKVSTKPGNYMSVDDMGRLNFSTKKRWREFMKK
jgi:hypothetical protein